MPLPVRISRTAYNIFMLELHLLLIEQIVNNQLEYKALNVVVKGLTPRMKVNIEDHITNALRNILNNEHPIILKKLVLTIMESLNSSIIGLFEIREKDAFTPFQIKDYLYKQLEWLLDLENHSPSILGDYLVIYERNTFLLKEPEINNTEE